MASYPASLITYTNPAGTSLVASGPDHAADHTSLHGEVIAIETTVGTNSGTNILKNFVAGDLAARINNETFGSPTIAGGTIKNIQLIGTSQITGGTLANGLVGTSTIQGGTVANASIGTPTIIGGTVAVNGTTVPLSFGAAIVPTVGTLTDVAAGTLTANAQASQIFFSAMGTTAGNRTIGTPNNPTNGQSLTYAFKASGSANGTLVWAGTVFRFSQNFGTPTLGTGTTWNYYAWRYNGIDSRWDFQGESLNII